MVGQGVHRAETKAPGEHATMVERHHELLRRTILKIEDQCKAERVSVPFAVIVAEAALAKNTVVKVAGHDLQRSLRERTSRAGRLRASQRNATRRCVRRCARLLHRIRDIALASVFQETAQQRIDRSSQFNSRIAGEQLALEPGDLVDDWRKPATKNESHSRGPARVIEPPGRSDPQSEPSATVPWQIRDLRVSPQDLRRAFLYMSMLIFASWGTAEYGVDPLKLIIEIADSLG